MSKKYLHLIRHGEVEEAYQGKFVGRIDADLAIEGRKQMKKMADFCKNEVKIANCDKKSAKKV